MLNKTLKVIITIIFAVAAVVAGLFIYSRYAGNERMDDSAANNQNIGDIAPDFNAELLSGGTFTLSVNRGKVVFLNFWATWCSPCVAEMPAIQALSEKYGEQVKFTKLDTAKARRLAISEQVLGLPTIALYKDGQKIDEVTKDDATKGSIEAMIEKNL